MISDITYHDDDDVVYAVAITLSQPLDFWFSSLLVSASELVVNEVDL